MAAPRDGEFVGAKSGKELDRYLSSLERHGYSLATCVVTGDGIELQRGYGWSQIERSVLFTARTPFFLASLTKQIFASAILKLQVEAPVDRALAEAFL